MHEYGESELPRAQLKSNLGRADALSRPPIPPPPLLFPNCTPARVGDAARAKEFAFMPRPTLTSNLLYTRLFSPSPFMG